MATNDGRVRNESIIDEALSKWCLTKPSEQILEILEQSRVPSGPIYNVEDMMHDEHYIARGMFEQVEIDGKPLQIPALAPKLSRTPGKTNWPGSDVGSHTDEILENMLGLDKKQIGILRKEQVI
jgi:crotonobetainyl-CoA:carnitine CoA-transferase CaiB-like acyl-CoA transferase